QGQLNQRFRSPGEFNYIRIDGRRRLFVHGGWVRVEPACISIVDSTYVPAHLPKYLTQAETRREFYFLHQCEYIFAGIHSFYHFVVYVLDRVAKPSQTLG